jgi:hypothetical protein
MRRYARNALWLSIMLILAAVALKICLEHGSAGVTYVVVTMVMLGISSIPATVLAFRSTYVPLLACYGARQHLSGCSHEPRLSDPELTGEQVRV